MNFSDLFPSNYLGQDDFPSPRVLVIEKVTIEEVRLPNGKKKKPVLHFQGDVKPMICNKTNGLVLAKLYGRNPTGWPGKSIEVYAEPSVKMGGEIVGGIRVRIPTGPRAAAGPGPRASAANGAAPKAAPAPASVASAPPAPPPTLEQRHAQLLAGFAGVQIEENLRAWGRWGKQFPFTEQQRGEAEDRFHDALERIALAQSPTRKLARASA